MSEARTDWLERAGSAASDVESWVARVGGRWGDWSGTSWTNQELLGHLTDWSDFLMDQVEMLSAGRADAIRRIDIDRWNADRVAQRRGQSPAGTVDDWRRALGRALAVAAALPAAAAQRGWPVAWSPSPVTIRDLFELWLRHIDQHRTRLTAP